MSEQVVGVILGAFLILVNLIAFVFFARILYKNFKSKRQQVQRLKKLESNKCKGPHTWLTMPIEGAQTHVCRECYFSPKHDSFVKEYYVKEAIYTEQFNADYKKYFDEKVQAMVEMYGVSSDKIVEISEKVSQIKQEFSLQYLKKMLEELSQDTEKK